MLSESKCSKPCSRHLLLPPELFPLGSFGTCPEPPSHRDQNLSTKFSFRILGKGNTSQSRTVDLPEPSRHFKLLQAYCRNLHHSFSGPHLNPDFSINLPELQL